MRVVGGGQIRRIRRLKRRLAQTIYREWRPEFRFIDGVVQSALRNRLADADSADKTAIVIGPSERLARPLGIRKTRLLVLDFPQFTIENLALLSDGYDFIIADRALHRCDSIEDAAHETLRVLRPGGWFVHMTCLFDQTLGVPFHAPRLGPHGLRRLFSLATEVSAGGAGMLGKWASVSWAIGRKAVDGPPLVPTISTRRMPRRRYARPSAPKRGRVCVVAFARNEAPYLLEWIAHYRLLGFDRIVIYDNESNDASWRILAPLARAGVIDAVYWRTRRGQHSQQGAYNHARLRMRDGLEWCLFADLDEFLILREPLRLDDLIPQDPTVGALIIPWRIFGSSGQRHRGTGLTIERFRRAAAGNDALSKSLVRLRDVEWMETHWPKLLAGRMVDVAGCEFDPSRRAEPIADGNARIHHYFSRSYEEFQCKRARGMNAGPRGAKRPPSIFHDLDLNEIILDDAIRTAVATKEEMARLMKIVR